jgi:hypothetical protein
MAVCIYICEEINIFELKRITFSDEVLIDGINHTVVYEYGLPKRIYARVLK